MKVSEQGALPDRHVVIPRTLLFITAVNEFGEEVVLLLKELPGKRLWAHRYNGLGGHIEAGEDVRSAALRELAEEAGITPLTLCLRGVVHIDTGSEASSTGGLSTPGVMVFVFHGKATNLAPTSSREGQAEWIPLAQVAALPVVDDLPDLLAPRRRSILFAHYTPDADGTLQRQFSLQS